MPNYTLLFLVSTSIFCSCLALQGERTHSKFRRHHTNGSAFKELTDRFRHPKDTTATNKNDHKPTFGKPTYTFKELKGRFEHENDHKPTFGKPTYTVKELKGRFEHPKDTTATNKNGHKLSSRKSTYRSQSYDIIDDESYNLETFPQLTDEELTDRFRLHFLSEDSDGSIESDSHNNAATKNNGSGTTIKRTYNPSKSYSNKNKQSDEESALHLDKHYGQTGTVPSMTAPPSNLKSSPPPASSTLEMPNERVTFKSEVHFGALKPKDKDADS